jgi:hypothetical protein
MASDERPRLGDDGVVGGPERRCGPGRDADLGVDVLDVVVGVLAEM